MQNRFLLLALLFSLFSCAEKSVPLSPEPPVSDSAIEPVQVSAQLSEPLVDQKFDFSFEELHAAANYTTVVFSRRINAQIAKKKVTPLYKCDPKSDNEINVWSMQLKSLLDQQAIYVEQNILTDKSYIEKFSQCEKTCMCGDYAAVLQNFNPSQLSKTQLFLISDMERKHREITEDQMLTCAQQFKNFCGSKLHIFLKKIAQR